jgi:hypothetical protein
MAVHAFGATKNPVLWAGSDWYYEFCKVKKPQQVNAWATGVKIPQLETAFKMAAILQCQVDDLYELVSEESKD